jgi:hypothetical protein
MKNILFLMLMFTFSSVAFSHYECTNADYEELTLELTEYGYYVDYFNSMGEREVSFLSSEVLVNNENMFELRLPTDGTLFLDKTTIPAKATIKFFKESMPINFECELLARQN